MFFKKKKVGDNFHLSSTYNINHKKLEENNLDFYYKIYTIANDDPLIYSYGELTRYTNIIKQITKLEETQFNGALIRKVPFVEFNKKNKIITPEDVISYLGGFVISYSVFVCYKLPAHGVSHNYDLGKYNMTLTRNNHGNTKYNVILKDKNKNEDKSYIFKDAISLKKMLIEIYNNKNNYDV